MKITLFQMDVQWENVAENLEALERALSGEFGGDVHNPEGVDVLILPEMFATGFSMSPRRMAQPASDSLIVNKLKELAAKYNFAIITTVAVSDSSKISNVAGDSATQDSVFYNRLYFIEPSGKIHTYDKRHTFSLSGENLRYESGQNKLIVEYKGVRICPLVCYDLRFPVYSRNVDNEYDVLVYVASWPEVRIDAWDRLLPARAIENQCYLIGVNRVGDDPRNHYCGHSVAYDYMGNVISNVKDDEQSIDTVEINLQELNKFRSEFAFWQDADKFEIKWN